MNGYSQLFHDQKRQQGASGTTGKQQHAQAYFDGNNNQHREEEWNREQKIRLDARKRRR